MERRRVVTGHDASGKAIVVDDQLVAPVTLDALPGAEFHQLWGADSVRSFPDDGTRPKARSYFPPVGGFRFGFFTVVPDRQAAAPADADADSMAATVQFERRLPGMAKHFEAAAPGMHTTATIDYGVVLSGQAVLELDDGAMVTLNAGDAYVQNGTRHRWSNPGDVPAVIAVTFVGANHERVD
jgi:mannose-6-phosphate isomerase-like protein (cupin superfamily)